MPQTPNVQIGFGARLFSNERTASEEIRFGNDHNFHSIQFRGQEEGLNESHLRADFETIATLLSQADIIPTMELLIGIDESGRTQSGKSPSEILSANLPAITKLSFKYVHWHLYPYNYQSMETDEKTIRQLEDASLTQIASAVSLSRNHGFKFGIENNDPEAFLFAHPNRCIELLNQIPNLGFVWDLNHTAPQHVPSFQSIANRMSMIHISDTPLPETNHHLPLGQGNIDFPSYLQQLQTNGFNGPAILEIGGLPKSGGYDKDTDKALITSHNHLESILAGKT